MNEFDHFEYAVSEGLGTLLDYDIVHEAWVENLLVNVEEGETIILSRCKPDCKTGDMK